MIYRSELGELKLFKISVFRFAGEALGVPPLLQTLPAIAIDNARIHFAKRRF